MISSQQLFEQSLQFLKEQGHSTRGTKASLYWLFAHTFGLSKTDISTNKNIFYEDSQAFYESALHRLAQHEPIQYIVEETDFYGNTLRVTSDVLIPRPETELLVDFIIKKHRKQENLRILDIGTGSGCIAVTLAQHFPDAEVYALDISQKALQVAQSNAENLQVKLYLIEADILHSELEVKDFDIIVSNPPYITESEKVHIDKNVLDFEPHLALFVPNDQALIFYEHIAQVALQKLTPKGILYFEINERFGEATQNLLQNLSFQQVKIWQDLQGKDRFVEGSVG